MADQSHFGVGQEVTYGTAVAPTKYFNVKGAESVHEEPTWEEFGSVRAWSIRRIEEATSAIRGDVPIEGNYQDIGVILKHLIGDVDDTGSGPYTHTFPGSTGIPATGRIGLGLTLEMLRADGTLNWRYAGCKVIGLSLAASPGSSPVWTVSFFGKTEDNTASPATPSYPDDDLMLYKDLSVEFDSSAMDVESVSLNVQFPTDEPFGAGSVNFIKEPKENGFLSVTGECVMWFDDMTEYNIFKNRSDVDVAIIMDDGTHSLTINQNKCKLTTPPTPPLEGRNRLKATFGWTSIYDTDATENIQCVLVNDQATVI